MKAMEAPIETERLILRDFLPEDGEQVQTYARDPEVVRYLDWGPNTPEETRAFIDRAIRSSRDQPRRAYNWP